MPTAIVTTMGVGAMVWPYHALIALAGIGPLAGAIFVATRAGYSGFHFEEALVLAFITGWAARRAVRPRPSTVAPLLIATVIVLAIMTLASAVVTTAIAAAEQPSIPASEFVQALVLREYLLSANALLYPLLFWEGLVLLVIVAETCAGSEERRLGVIRMAVAGASGVAVLNLTRIVAAGLSREDASSAVLRYLGTARVSVQYADLNAAGSYFALMLLVSLGIAIRWRIAGLSSALLVIGLWLSGSRTALAAAAISVVLVPAVFSKALRKPRVLAGAGALLIVAAAAAWWLYPSGRNEPIGPAMDYRVLTAKAALQLTAANPVFGVGIGRLFPLAAPYVGRPENAHNNFLQIGAELGIPGLLLFLLVVGLALREVWRSAATLGPSTGLLAGLVAFLLSCLAGHPLLTPAVAYTFWVAVGLAAVPLAATRPLQAITRYAVIALSLILVLTLPSRIASVVGQANLEHAGIGLSRWHRDDAGMRYRWGGARSSLFAPSSSPWARFALRHGGTGPDAIDVRIVVDGREADGVLLEKGADWRYVRVRLTGTSEAAFSRIDLIVRGSGSDTPLDIASSDTGGVLMVGRVETGTPAEK